ncbi:hypothetical protein SLEP1_g9183 [Rubroshorea leprosula]|uniref:CobW C-terminal domain-containing protein n=1 Tax=Rubroshorea leprosula TaxID=152421 RepID=A0AAV5I454_9ROSI|nr:hypothetical protein SLEP1_g9183 [Rubroshorea leprosula]
MAARFLISRTSPINLRQLLPAFHHTSSHFLTNLHSSIFPDNYSKPLSGYSRGFASEPTNNLDAAALSLDNRVSATIITGFLGSGKVSALFSLAFFSFNCFINGIYYIVYQSPVRNGSKNLTFATQTTLLNHILTAQHGKRIAVIENEFGEVDIDGSLVASHSSVSEDVVMVSNGCLCCTVRGDLVKMLLELVKKKREKFDHIVIETTGLAKPAPVIETFCADELVSQHVKLDGVVTLVDSKHAMQHLNELKPRFVVNEVVEQVAYADRIILNKIDLVTEAELEKLTDRIKHINGMAQIKRAKFGDVDVDFVLGVGGYDLERIDSEVHVDDCHFATHGEHGHREHHHDHVHDSAVSSVSIVSEGTLDLDEVDDWLERLIEEKGEDLYRMKGVLSINGSDQRYVFQGVQSILDGCPGKTWEPNEKRTNKLVFIGRNLDETALRKGFQGCLV